LAYRDEGYSFAEIGKKIGFHKNTVRDAYIREETAVEKKDKKKRGRPLEISQQDRRRIVREVRQHGEKTYAEMQSDLGLECSVSAITKIAEDAGYAQLRQPHKGALTATHLSTRLA